jgi:dihydrolipoamide dehydrogenase
MNYDYDIIFIGAGPAGYVGAIRARQLGLSTAVIEKDKAGGVCLNIGCIPSKALIDRATQFRSLEQLRDYGIKADLSEFDYARVQASSRSAADTLSKGVSFLLKKNRVDYISGEAQVEGAHRVAVRSLVDGSVRQLSASALVVATGSSPRPMTGFDFDEERILSSTGALFLQRLPKTMAIIGGGAIGIEFAYIMNSFGVQVHLVELMDRVLPMEDPEVSQLIQSGMEKRGVVFYTHKKAQDLKKTPSGELVFSLVSPEGEGTGQELRVDRILVSAGRLPRTSGLGLETLGVRLDRGYVVVGDYYETSVSSVFAVGDIVAGEGQLAHVASAQAELVAERVAAILGKGPNPWRKRLDPRYIPQAVYCEPQVASFGAQEATLALEKRPYKVARFPFRAIGKAVAVDRPEGFVKVLSDPLTGEILGASAVGAEATELIHELLVAAQGELTVDEIIDTVHAHPTFSEIIKEASLASQDRAIHV